MTVTVVIPVGPQAHHRAFLTEALDSVANQSRLPDAVLLIDDMAGLTRRLYWGPALDDRLTIWRAPWLLGVAGAFNAGVGLAETPTMLLMGADDRLLPGAIEAAVAEWEAHQRNDGYYYLGVQYSDGRPSQTVPCNAAMVTKGLWAYTGGFPVETASGAPDAALVSILMTRAPHRLISVAGGRPLYWYRVHDNTDTARRAPWQGVILETRDLVTKLWAPPDWGRY